ncbi:hypothetical protein JVT61DRAFT_11062 [Boletus reticuloceps]|uniref:Uncharacterized protein n=1 Tax=Boletus reticuloceps TaxID=495285 RepID=A0A8I3A5N3_9AGAM|nr:hypothetical protein JVT61DRAFT_11062 [Boletus reticuloceps]
MNSKSSPSRQQMSCDKPQGDPGPSTGNQTFIQPPQPKAKLPTPDCPVPVVVLPSLDRLQAAVVPSPLDQLTAYNLEPEPQISSGGQEHPSTDAPPNDQSMSVGSIPESDTSPPDLQASVNSASVLIGDDIPESQSSSTMHLQDVLVNCYEFNYDPYSDVTPPPDTNLSTLAQKICEGGLTLPGGKSLRMAATAFLEKLTKAQPPDSLSDMGDET